jgi:predicted nucleic-acid-binding Zn-ribbon protein
MMKKGQCLKCKSENVVASQGKGGVGADSALPILFGKYFANTPKWTTYLCLDCGYYENYIEDRAKLDQIGSDLEKMGWKKVK